MMNSFSIFRILCFSSIIFCLITSSGISNTFVVTNTSDSGAGSLRQAMLDARTNPGADTIIFNIPIGDPGYDAVAGIWRIQPLSALPEMWTDGMILDGATQAAFIGGDPNPLGPEIVLDGSNAGEATGLYLNSSHNEIKGMTIHQFYYGLIYVIGDSNKVTGCYIGPDVTGQQRLAGARGGISIFGSYNIIGGTSAAERNVIAGNSQNGITIQNFADYNSIVGNYIGINSSGTDTLGNSYGIRLAQSSHNIIGPNNVISGNWHDGLIFIINSDSNRVIGNFIGADPSGTMAWGNGGHGISFADNASHNVIGGSVVEDRNIISGNGGAGVSIHQAGTDNNRLTGNYIGVDISGTIALPNEDRGIAIINGARNNVIGGATDEEGNIISGNSGEGILITGYGSDGNTIRNNYIGVAADASNPIPNGKSGVSLEIYAGQNIVGPDNTIAFNKKDGVYVGSSAVQNKITRNSIYRNERKGIFTDGGNDQLSPPVIAGLDPLTGTAPPNATIEIFSGPDDEGKYYEMSVPSGGNGHFIWAGSPAGPYVTATATDGNGNTSEFSVPRYIAGFVVTTTADVGEGSLRWAIEQTNLNPGPNSITFNIPMSDNGYDGTVWLIRPLTTLPALSDGGTSIDGYSQTINQGDSNPAGPEIVLDGSAVTEGYSVGLLVHSPENSIYGLSIAGFSEMGIELYFAAGHHNRIIGNHIGNTAGGSDGSGNGYGISIGGSARQNVIGGTQADERNVISGNKHYGVSIYADSNVVIGNYIGTDAEGMVASGNGTSGIVLGTAAAGNRIGGSLPGEGNVISGNKSFGIAISGALHNTVQGNIIGLNSAATDTLSNQVGIFFENNAANNIIGSTGAGAANIISGNRDNGILLYNAHANRIAGNRIGTDLAGQAVFPNGYDGIAGHSGAQNNQIGPGNIICFNQARGIVVYGVGTCYNRITQNSIFDNSRQGILLYDSGNMELPAPVIIRVNPLEGTAPPNSIVEIFADSSNEGRTFIGAVTADAGGAFRWDETIAGPYVTATATDEMGNTSEFSVNSFVAVHKERESDIPKQFSLMQNYPNPFNPNTVIEFALPKSAFVTLKVYNLLGEKVATLVAEQREAGIHKVNWEANGLASGVYLYRLQAGDFLQSRKLILMR